MQVFIRENGYVKTEKLLAWDIRSDERDDLYLFYVRSSDRARYRSALEAVETISWYDLTPIDEHSFYVFVSQQTHPITKRFTEAFGALEVIVVPPIVFDRTGTMGMTIVGDGPNLRSLLESLPAEVSTEVCEVGEFDHQRRTLVGSLTDRQLEALAVAVDCGYYDVPREGSIDLVATRLECAPSTASDHLRKAESKIVHRLVTPRESHH